jgi:ABC-2 type transport system permease protein
MIRPRRLLALIGKEWKQILRDPLMMTIALAGPVCLSLLFGFGLSLDTERIPVGIVLEHSTPEARDLAGAFYNARYFRASFYTDRRQAERSLAAGEVNGIVILAGDFARPVWSDGGAPVQVLVDGVDGRTGRVVANYVEGAVANWLLQRVVTRQDVAMPLVQIKNRVWFNPELRSRYFVAPGAVALIMTMTGALLAALLIAREWESGIMEALLATPASASEILLARLVSYLALGIGSMTVTLAITVAELEVPFRGSFLVLAAASSLFMLAVLSMGFLISSLAKSQVAAGKFALAAGYMPTIMLSGLLFDLRNAPEPIQWISHLVSARYFVAILHTLFLVGDAWRVILPNLAGLAIIALVLLAAVVHRSRKRLG